METDAGSAPRRPEVVRVRRELLAACMTCPLCKKLLRDATTIYECLHTFCRKCIIKKLNDEEVDCCPICNIDLGCVPVEKLRPDHSLQDVRSKIFPFKRRKVNAPQVIPTITLPVRRKERSLSSLVVNTPRVATQSGLTGRRTKVTTRRASSLRGLSPLIDEPIKKEGNNVEDRIENSSSPEILAKMTQNKRQSSSNAEPSNHTSNKDLENGGESFFDKAELWKPLNCLVEAANRTRGLKSGPPSPSIKAEQSNDPDNEGDLHKGKIREHPNKLKVQDDKNYDGSSHMPPVVVRRRRRKRRDLGTSTQALIDAARATRERRTSPIWLSLVPSFDPQRDLMPPQNSACYLRIKWRLSVRASQLAPHYPCTAWPISGYGTDQVRERRHRSAPQPRISLWCCITTARLQPLERVLQFSKDCELENRFRYTPPPTKFSRVAGEVSSANIII